MKILTISALGVLVMATPAVAIETTTMAPVKITSCVVARDDSKNDAQPGPAFTNGVTAVVVNSTTKAIKEIQLSGIYNGVTVTDTIPGPFAPGQSYTLHKSHTPMVYDGPDASCVLNHVAFADGTSWQMAMPPTKQ